MVVAKFSRRALPDLAKKYGYLWICSTNFFFFFPDFSMPDFGLRSSASKQRMYLTWYFSVIGASLILPNHLLRVNSEPEITWTLIIHPCIYYDKYILSYSTLITYAETSTNICRSWREASCVMHP